jgi:hypothetical protein
MIGSNKAVALAIVAIAVTLAACSDSESIGSATTIAGSTTSTTDASAATTTTLAEATTTTAPPATTAAPATTVAPAPTTTAAGSGCDGAGGIAPGAAIGTVLHGDIDGDLVDDTVTEYSLNGMPHVHALLATGGHSDTEVPIGFAEHVDISFEDFDYALGAPTKPPLAVLAVGPTKAGTAQFAFLTLTTQYCIRPWHLDGAGIFVGRISAEGPYEGLSCEIAAGNRYYALNTAEQAAPGGDWTITQTVFNHNFTTVLFDPPLPTFTVPDGPDVQALYGDFNGCDHPPMFP